jgi:hypothetical protein
MIFRTKYKPLCKGWVSEECAYTGNDVSEVEVMGLLAKMDLFAFELWSSRHLFIDDAVELPALQYERPKFSTTYVNC